MKAYIKYDKEGNILNTGVCQNNIFKKWILSGVLVLEGLADPTIHKIQDGKIIEKEVINEKESELNFYSVCSVSNNISSIISSSS